MKSAYLPILTTQAGSCLTMENWQELGISTVSFYLGALLMKPGYSLLNSLSSLQAYCGWPGKIVLNANLGTANSEGLYTLRSVYDGSRLAISQNEISNLILQLRPDWVIIPPGFKLQAFPQNLTIFSPEMENSDTGIHLSYDNKKSFAEFLRQVQQQNLRPSYVSGSFDYLQAQQLKAAGALGIETDKPANDALEGKIYDEEQDVNLLDSKIAYQFETMTTNCDCPTCMQKLTRAYLHHLYQQTPLLCQRFLIQHNVHFYKAKLETIKENS